LAARAGIAETASIAGAAASIERRAMRFILLSLAVAASFYAPRFSQPPASMTAATVPGKPDRSMMTATRYGHGSLP
jgi:hypothetical protein